MLGKNRIQELRWSRNMSLMQLERISGIGHSTISSIENYNVSPTFDTMIRISKAFHLDVWDVFYYDK